MWLLFGQKIPKDQVLHVVLGDAAPRVTEVRVRYGEASGRDVDFTREATFRYAQGAAPRVVTHEARLTSGDYTVEIEVFKGNDRAMVDRRVKLDGNPVSVDVRDSVP